MSNINFDNPWLLLIGIPLILAAVIPFIIAINKENRTINNSLSFVFHVLISILVTLTIAKTTYEMVIVETNIYVLADVSYSSNNNLSTIDEYIENITENVPRNSKIGVVCFGKDYELLVELGEDLKSVSESSVDSSATNIAQALEYTSSLFTDNVIKRIVIISDGEETRSSNIVSIVQALSEDDVYVDAIYLNNNLKDDTKEVQISQVDFVTSTYLNNEEELFVMAQANVETKAIAKLYENGKVYDQVALKLTKGYNTFSFALNTAEAGKHNYKVVIETEDDISSYNNAIMLSQTVVEKVKMLFVSSLQEDKAAAELLYGESAEIDFYVNNPNVPYMVEDLCVYDEFVLSNIDVRTLNNHTQFVYSLDTLVSEFGKSLVTLGNTYIQNNEDDEVLSSLSDMLPVKYGNNDNEDKLVTLVIDISRSMEQIDKFNIAKEVCCSVLDNLDDDVMVMVIAFFGEVGTVYQPESAANREQMKEKIRSLNAYQGTFMGSALQYTYDFVTNLPYKKNEVMLISDGLPYGEQEAASKIAVQKMAEANIIVSTIHTVTLDGRELMKELAGIGKGYYYYIDSLEGVNSLILNEVLNSLNEVILENSESVVSVLLTKDKLVSNIDELPNVKGLYNNSNKTNSKVVLNAKYTSIIGDSYDIPLYTYWDYGNGKVSSFTSSISGDWISYWISSPDAIEILKNIMVTNMPKERTDSAFIIDYEINGTLTNIIVKAPTLNIDSQINAVITLPDGTSFEKNLSFDSQNYVGQIDTDQVGEYQIKLSYTLGMLSYETNSCFSISYLPEYDSFTLFEASNLYYMVSNNGQISEDGNLVLENDNSTIRKYIIDFTPAFMIISVLLYVADIIVRKLRWADVLSLFKGTKKKDIKSMRGDINEK